MIKKEKFIKNIYMYLIFIYSFINILSSTYIDYVIPSYNTIYIFIQNLLILTFAFIFIILISHKITKKSIIVIYSILMLTIIILLKNRDKSLLLLITMLISFPKTIDIKKLCITIVKANALAIITTITLCKLNLIKDYVFMQRGVFRHGLGFVSANALANLITATLLIYILYKKNNWKLHDTIFWLLILILTNMQTNSRLALLLGIFGVFFATVSKYIAQKKIITNIIFKITKYIFPFLFVSLILLTLYMDSITYNQAEYKLNELFSGRLFQMVDFYRQYGIHLIGSPIFTLGIKNAVETGVKWVGIDTSYMNYTLRYGLIFMICLGCLYMKLGKRIKQKNMLYEAIYVITICIMGITENILLIPYFNFSLFLIVKAKKEDLISEVGVK